MQSKRIRAIRIPNSVSVPFGIISNQSEKRFVPRLIKNDKISILLSPIHSSSIQLSRIYSETDFELPRFYLY